MPHQLGLPNIHHESWKPLWAACEEMQIPISFHISALDGTGSEHICQDSPIGAFLNKVALASQAVLAEWLWSDMMFEHPKLKIILSEGGIGWLPYFLERADLVDKNHGPWMGKDWHGKKPSDVYREHFISCFIQDEAGVRDRDIIGVDTLTFENDYPHADITWPYTPEQLWNGEFEGGKVGWEVIDKITHRNALRTYRWDAVERLGRENCNVRTLRELGRNVDLTPISGGGKPPRDHSGQVRARDLAKLFPANLMDPLAAEREKAASEREKARA